MTLASFKVWGSIVLAGIVHFGNLIVPVLPPVWANLILALLGVYALFAHRSVVVAARAAGARV